MIKAITLFFLLPIATIAEVLKRILGLFLFIPAYIQRKTYRANHTAGKSTFLYYFLDDSIVLDSMWRVDKPLEYCVKVTGTLPDKTWVLDKWEPLGKLLPWDWWRAYNWGCLRNSAVNLRDAMYVGPMKDFKRYGWDRCFYEVRHFEKMTLPYLEIWLTKHFRIQCGWLKGDDKDGGFFQVQANTKEK
jgi:hypothetical protein